MVVWGGEEEEKNEKLNGLLKDTWARQDRRGDKRRRGRVEQKRAEQTQ